MTPEERAVIQAAIRWHYDTSGVRSIGNITSEGTLHHAVTNLIYSCDGCNYDAHRCPGCGVNLQHGDGACEECKKL